jgi:hypothetical protein
LVGQLTQTTFMPFSFGLGCISLLGDEVVDSLTERGLLNRTEPGFAVMQCNYTLLGAFKIGIPITAGP